MLGISTVLVSTVAAIAAAGPTPKAETAAAGIYPAARAECLNERRTDRAEFIRDFGSTSAAAVRRCIRREVSQATRECKAERRYDRADFSREYGGVGQSALNRCIRDEIS